MTKFPKSRLLGRQVFGLRSGMVHPYAELEGTSLWAIVESAVSELVLNNDLVENTARAYIVGHICQGIVSARQHVAMQLQE